ncbi:hypothetical protein [Drosophila suzukii associated hytrosavirus 1]|nr:hypothetical protein [Drosophila suzukii associated hytrosavirus 1]
MDVLIFESLNNDNLYKYLDESFFLVLWTSCLKRSTELAAIPFDGLIEGLRNGSKPYRYLRMHLRQYHPEVLGLPVVIVDFEKNFISSRFGYDLCVDVNDVVSKQTYNNRDISVIDTKKLFGEINMFVQQYVVSVRNVISEETILANNVVLTSVDMFDQVGRSKQRIMNKDCVLVVGSSFFTIYHNVQCIQFQQFLSTCHLVVWMNNKSASKMQIQNFVATMKTNNIKINYMLFGLDRNVKSITMVRRHLAPTKLPFVLIDDLTNIYDRDESQFNAMCDFDYYINLQDYLVQSRFYDMEKIIRKLRKFMHLSTPKPIDKIKIVEYAENEEQEDMDNDDDHEPQNFDASGRTTDRNEFGELPCKRPRKNKVTTNFTTWS